MLVYTRTTLDIPKSLLDEARQLLGAKTKSQAVTLPMSDAILAALAIQNDRRLLTWDQRFRRVPKLRVSFLK